MSRPVMLESVARMAYEAARKVVFVDVVDEEGNVVGKELAAKEQWEELADDVRGLFKTYAGRALKLVPVAQMVVAKGVVEDYNPPSEIEGHPLEGAFNVVLGEAAKVFNPQV